MCVPFGVYSRYMKGIASAPTRVSGKYMVYVQEKKMDREHTLPYREGATLLAELSDTRRSVFDDLATAPPREDVCHK